MLKKFPSISTNLKLTTFARKSSLIGDIVITRGGDIVDAFDGIDGVMFFLLYSGGSEGFAGDVL